MKCFEKVYNDLKTMQCIYLELFVYSFILHSTELISVVLSVFTSCEND